MNDADIISDRKLFTATLRKLLKERSGKSWRVFGGEGTSWGWVRIVAPDARLVNGYMSPEDSAELAKLLGLDGAHCQGISIPSGGDYRREYLARARGEKPTVLGQQYWD